MEWPFLPPFTGGISSFLHSSAADALGSALDIQTELSEMKDLLSQMGPLLQNNIRIRFSGRYMLAHRVFRFLDTVCDAQTLVDEFSMEPHLRRKQGTTTLEKLRLFFLGRGHLDPAKYRARLKRINSHLRSVITGCLEAIEPQVLGRRAFSYFDSGKDNRWCCFAVDEGFAVMGLLYSKSQSAEGHPRPEITSGLEWWQNRAFRSESEEDQFIGRDADQLAVLQQLFIGTGNTQVDEEARVLQITGVPGVGKTRLVKQIFWNNSVRSHFRHRFWVRALDGFSAEKAADYVSNLAFNIDKKLGKNPLVSYWPQDTFARERYLLVVDELSAKDREEWHRFKELLRVAGGNGSRIVLIARDTIDTEANAYPLKGLSEFHSWRLFSEFNSVDSGNARMRALVYRCSGVPLALRNVRFVEGNIFRHSMVKLIKRFQMSFEDLPIHLRICFAYCCLFPRNHEFDKLTLIQMWMARGLLVPPTGEHPESTGEEHLNILLQRSVFEDAEQDEFGNIRSFKMPNLMHEFAEFIAFEWGCATFESDPTLDYRDFFMLMYFRTLLLQNMPDVQSFQFKPLRVLGLRKSKIKIAFIGKLENLRYLDLSENAHIEMLPRSITRLRNLQTLKLSNCQNLKELPRDISKLADLRHLHIDGCWSLTHMPCGIGKLTSLRTLSLYVVAKEMKTAPVSVLVGKLSELDDLNNLRGGLELHHLENARDVPIHIKGSVIKKQYVETLALVWETRGTTIEDDNDDDDRDRDHDLQAAETDVTIMEALEPHPNLKGLRVYGYSSARFPSWLSSHSNLIKITLSNCIGCQYMPPLDQFLLLKYLILEKLSALEYITEIVPDVSSSTGPVFFPSLKQLSLIGLPKLEGWFADKKQQLQPSPVSFPVLSEVTIDDCSKLKSIPLLPNVEMLYLSKISKEQLPCLLQSSPGNNLKSFRLSDIRNLDYLPEGSLSSFSSISFLEVQRCPNLLALPPLTSVRSLTLRSIQRLRSLTGWMDDTASLENLSIKWCPLLDMGDSDHFSKNRTDLDLRWWPELELPSYDGDCVSPNQDQHDSPWGQLKNLRHLQIVGIPKLVFLPEDLRLLTKLESLELTACEGLTELPECMSSLQSLQQLILKFCPNLKSLPRALGDLTDLYKLKITGCPLLNERCCEDGEDWEQISHLYDIEVD